MDVTLSPERLKAYSGQVEFAQRLEQWPQSDVEEIIRLGSFVGSVIDQHESMERTMVHARAHIDHLEKEGFSVANGTVVTAQSLSGPKGRFTRSWHAPAGGLWGCLIYISTLLPRHRLLVPMAVGVACCESLRCFGAEGAVIRWINDVLIDGRKAGGFLAENFSGSNSGEDYCLLGFGINVNNRLFPRDLDTIATSLSLSIGKAVDLEQFSYCFFAKLGWNLGLLYWWEKRQLQNQFEDGEVRNPLISRWQELSDSLGRRVVCGFDVLSRPQYRATVQAIAGDGGLKLLLEDGSEVTEYSGEIRYLD